MQTKKKIIINVFTLVFGFFGVMASAQADNGSDKSQITCANLVQKLRTYQKNQAMMSNAVLTQLNSYETFMSSLYAQLKTGEGDSVHILPGFFSPLRDQAEAMGRDIKNISEGKQILDDSLTDIMLAMPGCLKSSN